MNLASAKMDDQFANDEHAQAQSLLNYADAYYIYQEFENMPQQGVCLANIGSIMYQRGDLKKAIKYYDKSIEVIEEALANSEL